MNLVVEPARPARVSIFKSAQSVPIAAAVVRMITVRRPQDRITLRRFSIWLMVPVSVVTVRMGIHLVARHLFLAMDSPPHHVAVNG